MEEKINFIVPEKISLLNHPILTEKWIQQKIADNPLILGLDYHKSLILKDKERIQSKGRLDLLFQCSECSTRYEVEVQLGEINESHIIRTIEYWDVERKRYPQYEHYAVLIAEDTSRFLNVISLLNRTIPLIVIKMEAYKHENNYWLTFTTVLDETDIFNLEEEEETFEVVDKNYWEGRGTPKTIALTDELLKLIKEFDKGYELKYNKFYIGLAKNGQPDNFVIFKPKKQNTTMEIKLKQSETVDKLIEDAGLDLMEYDSKWNRYRIRIFEEDLSKNKELIRTLLQTSSGKINN